MIRTLVSDILLGLIPYSTISDQHLATSASHGILHAASVASRLSMKHRKYGIVAITDEFFTGIIAIAHPDPNHSTSVCATDMGIIVDCDKPVISKYWPPQDRRRIRLLLIDPNKLNERANYLASLRT